MAVGWTTALCPDEAEFKEFGGEMATAIEKVSGNPFQSGSIMIIILLLSAILYFTTSRYMECVTRLRGRCSCTLQLDQLLTGEQNN